MKHTIYRFFTIIMIVSMGMTSIAQEDAQELIEPAIIDDVSIDGTTLNITGSLPDTCTQLGEVEQTVSDDTIEVMVMTTRPADAMCGAAIVEFETEFVLDTNDLDAGDYTLLVNTVELSISIGDAVGEATEEPAIPPAELSCPEPDEDIEIFDENGLCFAYPVEFDILAGSDFIFISQPLTSNAVLLIEISEATDEMSLEALQDDLDEDEVLIVNVVLGGEDTLIIESDTMREAYTISNEMLYHLILQPLEEDDETGEILWSTVIDSLVFEEIDN